MLTAKRSFRIELEKINFSIENAKEQGHELTKIGWKLQIKPDQAEQIIQNLDNIATELRQDWAIE